MLEQAMSENIAMKETQDESENEDESEEISMEV